MVIDILLVFLGVLAVVGGLVGCIVPVIPGPPVSYLGLILISLAGGWNIYAAWVLIVLAIVAVGAAVLDSILPAYASKRAGAGKAGVWGSVVGMLIGTFLFPPFGTFIGAFFGALLGEFLRMRQDSSPLKAAWGVFTGTMAATVAKLAVSGTIAVVFVRGVFTLFS